MPYWNDPANPSKHYKTEGWVNAGIHELPRKKVTYFNPHYRTHNRHSSHNGAIQIRDSFLIHAGPSNLKEIGWGSAGCVEIIGNFTEFKEDICKCAEAPAGLPNNTITQMVSEGLLFVTVEKANPPSIRNNLDLEIKL